MKNQTKEKIIEFTKRETGWHFGTGGPALFEIANQAIIIANIASYFDFETDAFPGVDGEIMVTVYHNHDYLEFICEVDNSVVFVHEKDGVEHAYREGLTFDQAKEELYKFGEGLWKNISESFIKITTTRKKDVSPAWPLETQLKGGSQLSQKVAYYQQVLTPAPTSQITMQDYHPFPPSIGSSHIVSSQSVAGLTNIQALQGTNATGT
jgi:hypothetical protein